MINANLLEMSGNEENEMPPSVFWALDPRLPRTAAQAAVEFDWLIQSKHGQSVNRSSESINTLSLLLSGAIGKTQRGADKKAFVDSLGLNLFAKAYNETRDAHPVKTREDLEVAIQQLISSLDDARRGIDIEESILTAMRKFCSSLSEYAAVYRKMAYGNHQEHPYQK